MVFNACISLKNLKTIGNSRDAAIMLADTVIITKDGPLNATESLPKRYDDVGYSLNDDATDEEDVIKVNNNHQNAQKNNGKPNNKVQLDEKYNAGTGIQTRARRRGGRDKDDKNNWAAIREHQKELLDLKMQEIEERYKSGNFIFKNANKSETHLEKISAYPVPQKVPRIPPANRIVLDEKNCSVFLPVNGKHVCFHISVIKNINKQQDGKISSLRFNFNIPGSGISNMVFPDPKTETYRPIYIKEMTFRSVRGDHLLDVMKKVKEMQKTYKNREQEADERGPQEDIILVKGRRPALQDLKLRPTLSGRKTVGTLECHVNGFRFYTRKQEKLDLLFNNIKHAFFQPCDNEIII